MNKMFPTQEVGSLAKPRWRIKGYRGKPLSNEEIAEAVNWGRKLRIENLEELVKLLSRGDSAGRKSDLLEWSAKYAIRFFETAGSQHSCRGGHRVSGYRDGDFFTEKGRQGLPRQTRRKGKAGFPGQKACLRGERLGFLGFVLKSRNKDCLRSPGNELSIKALQVFQIAEPLFLV